MPDNISQYKYLNTSEIEPIEGFKAVEYMQKVKDEINAQISELTGEELQQFISNAIEQQNLTPININELETI